MRSARNITRVKEPRERQQRRGGKETTRNAGGRDGSVAFFGCWRHLIEGHAGVTDQRTGILLSILPVAEQVAVAFGAGQKRVEREQPGDGVHVSAVFVGLQRAAKAGRIESLRVTQQVAVGQLAGVRRGIVDAFRVAEFRPDMSQVHAEHVDGTLPAGRYRRPQRREFGGDLGGLQGIPSIVEAVIDATEKDRYHLERRQFRPRMDVLKKQQSELNRVLGAVQPLLLRDISPRAA